MRCRRWPAVRDRSRAARTSSSGPGRGRRRCPTRSSRSTGSMASARSTSSDDGLRLGTLVTHGDLVANDDDPDPVHGARRRVGDRGLPRHAGAGHDRRQRDERLARRWTPAAPLLCFGATATLRSSSGERSLGLDELWTGPGTTSARPDELLVAIELPAPAAGTGSCYVRLEYRRQMEIAVVGATAVVTVDGDRVTDARVAITALTPTIRRVPEAESALTGTDGGDDGGRGRARPRRPRPLDPDQRRPRARPTTAGRWPR